MLCYDFVIKLICLEARHLLHLGIILYVLYISERIVLFYYYFLLIYYLFYYFYYFLANRIIILSSRHESDIPSLPGRQVSSS